MKNKILIDHVLIAVSKKEFEKWKRLSDVDPRVEFKVTETESRQWSCCYLRFTDGLYLEIIEESFYPARVGVALSSLGGEKSLLADLKLTYPYWEFQTESPKKAGKPWFNAYYSGEMESDHCFAWFMEYQGKFKKQRKENRGKLKTKFQIVLSQREYEDFFHTLQFCPLMMKSAGTKTAVFDEKKRGFEVVVEKRPKDRVKIKL